MTTTTQSMRALLESLLVATLEVSAGHFLFKVET
jgi:hypothetical protein